MALKLARKLGPEWFRPKWGNSHTDEPVEFEIRPLRQDEYLRVNDMQTATGSVSSEGMLYACRKGITDCRGIKADDGTELEWGLSMLRDIPAGLTAEVFSQIMERSSITEDEIRD